MAPNSTISRIQAARAAPGDCEAASSPARWQSAATWSVYTASSSAVRPGKWRYSVPIPTPARRAISSSEVSSAPRSVNASRAAAISSSRFRRASALIGGRESHRAHHDQLNPGPPGGGLS